MRLAWLLTCVLVAACGSTEGNPCSTPDAAECAGATTLLVCEGAKWTAYACPSCAGATCDWKGARNGDPCPRSADTYGTCLLDGRLVGCFWSELAGAGGFVETACSACVAGKSLEELGKCSGGKCSCN